MIDERPIVHVDFPARPLPAGGRVILHSSLTTRGAVRFKAIFIGPETLTACVLERLTIAGVNRLDLPLGASAPLPPSRAEVQRVEVQLGRLVALATQPIEIEIRSCHSQPQMVGAMLIGVDASQFPACTNLPAFVSRILGVERLACSWHATQARPPTRLDDWLAMRRLVPAEIHYARCGCLYWRADDFPPMQ